MKLFKNGLQGIKEIIIIHDKWFFLKLQDSFWGVGNNILRIPDLYENNMSPKFHDDQIIQLNNSASENQCQEI